MKKSPASFAGFVCAFVICAIAFALIRQIWVANKLEIHMHESGWFTFLLLAGLACQVSARFKSFLKKKFTDNGRFSVRFLLIHFFGQLVFCNSVAAAFFAAAAVEPDQISYTSSAAIVSMASVIAVGFVAFDYIIGDAKNCR
jgi:hypothetical protein